MDESEYAHDNAQMASCTKSGTGKVDDTAGGASLFAGT